MEFGQVINRLNALLQDENPASFNSSWILRHSSEIYRFILKNIRTEIGDINWDKVICSLDKRFQKIWIPPRHKPKTVRLYRNKGEVDSVLKNYKDKLYVFVAPLNEQDKRLRDAIGISLVRVAQKGNLRAQKQLIFFLNQLTQQWVEYCPRFFRWRGHSDDLEARNRGCIRCYRFTRSFIGYLFKTLEYSARGLQSFQAYSLDSCIPNTTIKMIDTLTKDPETNQVVRASSLGYHSWSP